MYCLSVPGQPTIRGLSTSATTIYTTWNIPSDSVVTSYEVMWQRDTTVGCPDVDEGSSGTIIGSFISYNMAGLEEDSRYNITARASNSAGSSEVSDTLTVMTLVRGRQYRHYYSC